MRFSLELDFLQRFRRPKKDAEERHKVPHHPFMGVFGRNTRAGVHVDEEGALSLSAVCRGQQNLVDACVLAP